jgi:hypothetical protein
MTHTGILFLLSALLSLVGWTHLGHAGSKMAGFDWRLLGAAVFLYLAVAQYRKN